MSRMLQALKRLEEKQQPTPQDSASQSAAENTSRAPGESTTPVRVDGADQPAGEPPSAGSTLLNSLQMAPPDRLPAKSLEPSFSSIDTLLLEAQEIYGESSVAAVAQNVPPDAAASAPSVVSEPADAAAFTTVEEVAEAVVEIVEQPAAVSEVRELPASEPTAPAIIEPPQVVGAQPTPAPAMPSPEMPAPSSVAPQPRNYASANFARLLEPVGVATPTPIESTYLSTWPSTPLSFATAPAPELSAWEIDCQRILADRELSQPIRQTTRRLLDDLLVGPRHVAMLLGVGAASHPVDIAPLLAVSLAAQHGDVLLVDVDTVGRQLTAKFDAVGQPGITDLLAKKETEQRAVKKTATPHLSIVAAGTSLATPGDAADAWTDLVAHWRSAYRLVLLCGGQSHDDASLAWARAADATYVAIRLGATEATVAQQAIARLQSSGARVLGCIAID